MVEIYATKLFLDYQNPWRFKNPKKVIAFGAIIANNFVTINAYIVTLCLDFYS